MDDSDKRGSARRRRAWSGPQLVLIGSTATLGSTAGGGGAAEGTDANCAAPSDKGLTPVETNGGCGFACTSGGPGNVGAS